MAHKACGERAGCHSAGLFGCRATVNWMATYTYLSKGDVIDRLENAHGDDRFLMASEAGMGADISEHILLAVMALVAFQATDLAIIPLESVTKEKSVAIVRIDCFPSEQFPVVVAFPAKSVLFGLVELLDFYRHDAVGIIGMALKPGVAGPAFLELVDRYFLHARRVAMLVLLPADIIFLMTTSAVP